MIEVSSFVPLLLMLSGGPIVPNAPIAGGGLALVLSGMNYIAAAGHVIR